MKQAVCPSRLQALMLNFWKLPPIHGNRGYRTGSSQCAAQVVISGISGRFPKASSIKELNEKLLKGEELTSETSSRWSSDTLPQRVGFLHCLDKFDAGFFNFTPRQANQTDPQTRLLLETVFECIIDAGVQPADLCGSKTGVFCGTYGDEARDYRLFHYNKDDEGYQTLGTANFMMAARIAFNLDLRGPSAQVCTGCSTSLSTLEMALHYIEVGKCEAAIVTSSAVQFNPYNTLDFMALQGLSPDGRCKTFDESANGYARAEAVVAIFVQKEGDARRNYARIRGLGSSTDGFKQAGIMHPNRATQEVLLVEVYEKAGVDPSEISYLEAHGTGTRAGDTEEIHAIHRVFCEGNRKRGKPLLVGSVKTNMGHAECAAGLCGVAKVVGAIQSGQIPGNLFFNKPHPEIKSFFNDNLKVVSESTTFDGGLVGISSYGLGGTNSHLILEPGPQKKQPADETGNLPVLFPFSGRSEAQVEKSIAEASEHADNPEFVFLLQNAYRRYTPGYPARGFGLFNPADGKRQAEVTVCESTTTRPIWVVFPGMGSQWSGMGEALLKIDLFAKSIEQSRATLRNVGVDLDHLLKKDNQSIFTDIQDAFLVITVMQIALWDTLKGLEIKPHGFIGHSAGEFLCAYADGCYTAEETLQLMHARGRAMKETQKVVGGMSSIGMSAVEIKARLPPGVELACCNAPGNVTISGEYNLVTSFTKNIKNEGIFAAPVNACGIAAHSLHVREAGALLKIYAGEIIKGDRPKSPRWISTSIPESEWGSELAKFASADYIENNVCQPVLFHQALQHVQPGSIVIEVSPSGFFQALLADTVPRDCLHVEPMRAKTDDKLWHFFESVGKLYNSGVDLQLDKLYPSVSTPVSSNVPSLSHLVEWDHTASWRTSILSIPLNVAYESIVDIEHPSYAYLAGHNVDGRILMPATGHLCAIWKQLGDICGRYYEKLGVQFTNVIINRATTLSSGVGSVIGYKIDTSTGMFTIENQDEIVVSGRVEMVGAKPLAMENVTVSQYFPSDLVLTKEDVYKEARLNGYNYSGLFQGIEAMDSKGRWADITWNGNWTCFLDTVLQLRGLSYLITSRHLSLPVDFEKITIDPVQLKKHLSRVSNESGKQVVRVLQLPNQKTIVAPGIEIKGVELRVFPRILRSGNVAYERHTFCPFIKTSEDVMISLEELVDLVLDNKEEKVLQVADVFTDKANSLALEFQRILYRKPRLQDSAITMITLTKVAEKLEESAKIGQIVAKESKALLAPESPSDIVFLDDPSQLALVTPKVNTNGFVLVHFTEPIHYQQPIGLQKCSSRMVAEKTFDLYHKVELEIPEIVHVSVDSPDFSWVPELQAAILKGKKSKCKIYVTSQKYTESGILGLVNCLRDEDGGERIRCIFDPEGQLSLDFDQPDSTLRSIIINDLFVNVLRNGDLGSYRHVSMSQTEHKHVTRKTAIEAFVGILTPGDLSSLHWIESPTLKPASSSFHQEQHSKCYKVAFSSINFRDVLLATRAVPLEPHLSYNGPYLGWDFSGFDENGKRVMGLSLDGNALATSTITDPRFVWEVPNNWTLEEAATIPLAYGTVLYAFHTRAGLRPGQSVLIHAGTGGVGQAAISVALALGCQVFTTVGTAEKREYIKQIFPQITDDYIGNSRDTSFERQVMEMTQGRGVDVALNSLTGDKLLATARCVAYNGTFLEIGVSDAFNNTKMGLRPLLQNLNVCGVYLNHKTLRLPGNDKIVNDLMDQGLRSGVVKPLPVRVFANDQIEEAFRLMASGKHMGKLVIKVCEKSDWRQPPKLHSVIKRSYFSPKKTYLVVGGLGGFGLEVAGWMVERGARKLILNSRSGITNGYQALCLRRWRESGVQLETPKVDLSDKLVAELFIRKIVDKGEIIGGIINCALSLSDGEFSKQTIASFQQVSKPKDFLTKTLDEISRELCPELEYFVAFSSLSCGRGNAGQSNYGWGNSAMERICEKRKDDGLHGLAIQWSIVGQVGYVTDTLMKGNEKKFEIHGTQAQSLDSCLHVLDAALQQPFPVVSSCVVTPKGAVKKQESDGFLFKLQKLFGIADFTTVPAEKKLSDLGLDSLVAVELKQLLERYYDVSFTKEHLRLLTVADILSINMGTYDANKFKRLETSHDKYEFYKLHKESLISLKTHPSDRNAFIVYGADGGCNHFRPLASRLNANVYGFQFTGKDGWHSITELAGLYVKEIKERQPSGPYTIMGFSGGASIAFELARRLKTLGETVQNLVFLDGCPSFEKQNMNRRCAFNLLNSLNILRGLPQDFVARFESSLTGDLGHDFLEVCKVLNCAKGYELAPEVSDAYAFLTARLAEHTPQEPYDGAVILIQATDPNLSIFKSSDHYNLSQFCTGQVRRHRVAGNHLSFLREESVGETADVINECLG